MLTLEIDASTIFATVYRGDEPVATVQRHRSDDTSGITWSGYDTRGNVLFATMLDLGAAGMIRRIERALAKQ